MHMTMTDLQNKIEEIKSLYPQKRDKSLIQQAYDVAQSAHAKQKRESGEPYITHPLEVANILAKINMDTTTIAAALLHDVVDDTPITIEKIKKDFGEEIAFLVEGVSKLGKLKYRGLQRHAENLRKMLIAMAQDVRVILIKFADRIHNMKTLDALPKQKKHRIALETLEIYAPIASRLGVNEFGKQLEDLAFPYIYPEQYEYVKTESNYRFAEAEKYLKKLAPRIKKELAKGEVNPKKIEMRAKHYYSLWKKLEKYNYNWSKINDLIAVRIIVNSVEDCYKTLGIIHALWKPLPGRIKDYIALPKQNGYQSLHTTVFCINGRQTEFQIRTSEMHENAEYGITSHWRYKNKNDSTNKYTKKKLDKTFDWVEQLQEWKKDTSDTEELLDNLKIDVFSDRIFVFSPNGDVVDLPKGATPVDFAYTIHSDIGDKCSGALINGKMMAISSELNSGDVVEIITNKNKTPSQSWLTFVKTRSAKGHIKRWFREQTKDEVKEIGLRLINNELKSLEGKLWSQIEKKLQEKTIQKFNFNKENDLFESIGRGDISINRVIQILIESPKKEKVVKSTKKESHETTIKIAGIGGLKTHIAQCCKPKIPETIAAYITVDRGASIHKINCKNLRKIEKTDKILPAYWSSEENSMIIKLRIEFIDRVGLLQDISKKIASLQINIISLNANVEKSKASENIIDDMELEIKDIQQLKNLIEKINTIDGVIQVTRRE